MRLPFSRSVQDGFLGDAPVKLSWTRRPSRYAFHTWCLSRCQLQVHFCSHSLVTTVSSTAQCGCPAASCKTAGPWIYRHSTAAAHKQSNPVVTRSPKRDNAETHARHKNVLLVVRLGFHSTASFSTLVYCTVSTQPMPANHGRWAAHLQHIQSYACGQSDM